MKSDLFNPGAEKTTSLKFNVLNLHDTTFNSYSYPTNNINFTKLILKVKDILHIKETFLRISYIKLYNTICGGLF